MSITPTRLETLAIHGGTPVRKTLLPYGRQSVDEGDIESVLEVLKSDWLTTGPKVGEFEERFAAWVGAKYAVSFSSGTAALHGAAFAAGTGTGGGGGTTPPTIFGAPECVVDPGGAPCFSPRR